MLCGGEMMLCSHMLREINEIEEKKIDVLIFKNK